MAKAKKRTKKMCLCPCPTKRRRTATKRKGLGGIGYDYHPHTGKKNTVFTVCLKGSGPKASDRRLTCKQMSKAAFMKIAANPDLNCTLRWKSTGPVQVCTFKPGGMDRLLFANRHRL